MYGTSAAVETFVDVHYPQQIEHLQVRGGPEGLLTLLLCCQADEQHHRDEAATLAVTSPGVYACAARWSARVRPQRWYWQGDFDCPARHCALDEIFP